MPHSGRLLGDDEGAIELGAAVGADDTGLLVAVVVGDADGEDDDGEKEGE